MTATETGHLSSLTLPPGAAFARALAGLQGALTSVGKDRDVEVKSEKGRYSFRYATLAAIWDVARGPLQKFGFSVLQLPSVDPKTWEVTVETRLLHESGESATSTMTLPTARKDVQGLGSVITYARRYALSAMLGITSADEDDDAEAGSPHIPTQAVPARRTPPVATKAPPAGPPTSVAELELQMRSCSSKAELARVAAKVAGAGLGQVDRDALLVVYRARLAELAS